MSDDAPPLAVQLADALLLTVDEAAQHTAWGMWDWCRPQYQRAADLLRELQDDAVSASVAKLTAEPGDLAAYHETVDALTIAAAQDANAGWWRECRRVATGLRTTARIAVHVGSRVGERPVVPDLGIEEIAGGGDRSAARPGAAPVRASIIIPFRAAAGDGRARNLAACLAALDDQSVPRRDYRVVVVESDSRPRWREVFEPLADTYLFARNPGRFNKSWAVNCGAVHGGAPDDLVCVLDADMLVGADFIARAVAAFDDDTLQGHWPFRDVVFADADSSRYAVAARCRDRSPDVDQELLRGTRLRRPPGGCIWLRRSLFRRIAGMDERFAGWGGEDNDLGWRAELYGGLERFGRQLIHLDHARPTHRDDSGAAFHEAIPWCTWPTDSVIGDLDKYPEVTSGGNTRRDHHQ